MLQMLPMIYSWNSANTAGYTKRTMRNALTLMAFCIGNVLKVAYVVLYILMLF